MSKVFTKKFKQNIANFLYQQNEKLLSVCVVGVVITDWLNNLVKEDLTMKMIIALIVTMFINWFIKKFLFPYRYSLKSMLIYFWVQILILFKALKKFYVQR